MKRSNFLRLSILALVPVLWFASLLFVPWTTWKIDFDHSPPVVQTLTFLPLWKEPVLKGALKSFYKCECSRNLIALAVQWTVLFAISCALFAKAKVRLSKAIGITSTLLVFIASSVIIQVPKKAKLVVNANGQVHIWRIPLGNATFRHGVFWILKHTHTQLSAIQVGVDSSPSQAKNVLAITDDAFWFGVLERKDARGRRLNDIRIMGLKTTIAEKSALLSEAVKKESRLFRLSQNSASADSAWFTTQYLKVKKEREKLEKEISRRNLELDAEQMIRIAEG